MTQKSANYISTRGGTPPMGFAEAVMTGLAPDNGLLLPQEIPDVRTELNKWRQLSYPELAEHVIHRFAGDDIGREKLSNLLQRSYARFDVADVVPVKQAGDVYVAELYHGPTLAFKDLALQFLGNLFEYLLERSGEHLNVIGATSGDTGSAAIEGIRGKRNMNIFIMFPEGRISTIQEQQMTSVRDQNVHPIAVEGTFDDTQRLLKALFADLRFKADYRLAAVNSINWARIVAQIVYYFYAVFRVQEQAGNSNVQVAVPTGNFGNVFAGYLACRMGAPIERLILATNENNILQRFFAEGIYQKHEVKPTLSPSMDIQIASNFERYLYYRCDRNPERVRDLMAQFQRSGTIRLDGSDPLFTAGKATRDDTIQTIRCFYHDNEILLDPHTAVGVSVARRNLTASAPTVCLATAHPAKFTDAIEAAIGTSEPAQHPRIAQLADQPCHRAIVAPEKNAVQQYISAEADAAAGSSR